MPGRLEVWIWNCDKDFLSDVLEPCPPQQRCRENSWWKMRLILTWERYFKEQHVWHFSWRLEEKHTWGTKRDCVLTGSIIKIEKKDTFSEGDGRDLSWCWWNRKRVQLCGSYRNISLFFSWVQLCYRPEIDCVLYVFFWVLLLVKD